jgi:hypothetical protein
METCEYCRETYSYSDGIFCDETTPYYQFKNCDLDISELVAIARAYDNDEKRDPEDRLETSYEAERSGRYEEINKEALCSELATKLRTDAPAEKHYFCSGKSTLKCINAKVESFLEATRNDPSRWNVWNGIVPCFHPGCNSFYDTANLLEHLNRPTRKLLQNALVDLAAEKEKRQQSERMLVVQEQKEEHLTTAIYDTFTSMLLPTCPNCKAPFADWDNCYSIECKSCLQYFCGSCLACHKPTNQEMHNHLRVDCKKHKDWTEVNPQCNYYGSPERTPIMYINVQTNKAKWVNERRAMYPTDPYLMAPTILEKVALFYKTLSKTVQHELLTRLFDEMKRDIQQGTDKPNFSSSRDIYGRVANLTQALKDLVPPRTKFYLDLFDKENTCLFSDNFFPISLFSFMDPLFFYDVSQQRTFTTLFSFTNPFYTKRLTDATHRDPFNVVSMLYENFNFYSNVTMTKETYTSTFCDLLRTNRAVIAGGFVTNAVCPDSFEEKKRNSDNKDIDMYVHLRNAKSLVMGLVDLGYYSKDIIYTPSYDESFMRKNHILYRIHMVYERQDGARLEDKCPPIDVMIIPDEFELRSIVTNFDLTFCQVWYDGFTVQSDHWNDIDTKRGSLRSEYHAAYQQGNLFLRKRISKYQERGFVIQCPDIPQRVADILRQIESYISFYKKLVRIIVRVKKLLDGEEDVDQPYITTEEHRELIHSTRTVMGDININLIVANTLFQQSREVIERIEVSCDTILRDEGNSFSVRHPAVPGRRLNEFWVDLVQELDLLIYYNTQFRVKPLYKLLRPRKIISPELEEQWIVTKMYKWMTSELLHEERLTFVVEHPLYPCTVKRLREIVSSYHLLGKRERTMINILHRTFQKETYPWDPIRRLRIPVVTYFNDSLPNPYKEVVNKYKDNFEREDKPFATNFASTIGFRSENGEEEGRKIRSNRRKNRKNKNRNRNSLLKKGRVLKRKNSLLKKGRVLKRKNSLLKKGRASTHRKSMKKSMKK